MASRQEIHRRDEEYFTNLAYRKAGRSRFTQDSPILADVFVHYGMSSDKHLDLLLTPDWSRSPGAVAQELREWLGLFPDAEESAHTGQAPDSEGPLIAHNQSVVAARLTFEELICNVLPMSWWWQNRLIAVPGLDPVEACTDERFRSRVADELLAGLEYEIADERFEASPDDHDRPVEPERLHWLIQHDFVWAARLFWVVQHSNRGAGKADAPDDDSRAIAGYFLSLIGRVERLQKAAKERDKPKRPPDKGWVYSIHRNRPIHAALHDSVVTMKADAAAKTFEVSGRGISWAIIDTGVDARHIAFRERDGEGRPHSRPFGESGRENRTRIRATYDFSDIRAHLSKDQERGLSTGRMLDWESLGEKFRVGHTAEEYRTPALPHGTHVAGILAADWRPDPEEIDPLGPPPSKLHATRPLIGLCPDIELYDLRVFRADGSGDEFAVMSALQFVRSLNQRHETLQIHGVNLSLAMQHEVSNYACGRSPVCEECTRLVGNGVMVVAAAGNRGRSLYLTPQNQWEEGYRAVSIADPGNAEAVLTVGSTHRKEPHTYGVSYFSSRGPTGDGRTKPDLVAPGEKIVSTVPGDRRDRQDGTSQAAPHVSGAAALLMSRHRELIGQPARVKQILMDSATDLGRERHYQGAGLVDVMRAIQSI